MTSGSRDVYERSYHETSSSFDADEAVRREARERRRERLNEHRSDLGRERARETRNEDQVHDTSKVRLGIKSPRAGVNRLHVFLVDNSGSNERIAKNIRAGSGYLVATLNAVDPEAQYAFMYFSDHRDGMRFIQEIDWFGPDEEGDVILNSTNRQIMPANGHDAPEAIECALKRACELDFGDAEEKHLYLVSDQIAHGMSTQEYAAIFGGDEGCPKGQMIQDSIGMVRQVYRSFQMVGCAEHPVVGKIQRQFFTDARVALDHLDLSHVKSPSHRLQLVSNALLFLVARHQGMQSVEMFLSALYEKWLADPVFGMASDTKARGQIHSFGEYLEAPQEQIEAMMQRIFGEE
jgi:hypothetical protein